MQLSKHRFYGGYPQFYNINLSIFNYDDLALGGLTYIPWIKMVKMYLDLFRIIYELLKGAHI